MSMLYEKKSIRGFLSVEFIQPVEWRKSGPLTTCGDDLVVVKSFSRVISMVLLSSVECRIVDHHHSRKKINYIKISMEVMLAYIPTAGETISKFIKSTLETSVSSEEVFLPKVADRGRT
ncbi:hypothetical protein YC2023_110665 [Brassica napus]